MNKLIWAPALCLALVAAAIVHAEPPEADANRDFAVAPQQGPWMICAATFTGPAAPALARQLAVQIRTRHNLPAYVFNYADEERKRQKEIFDRQIVPFAVAAPEPDGGVVRPIPHRKLVVRVEEQCAVMVGGYPDENAAHAALVAVKKLPMPDLTATEGVRPYSTITDRSGKEMALNPFSQSMVVRNPTVPHETKLPSKEADPFLKTLNAGEEFSMLQCPQKWTLAVKEYLGSAMVEQQTGLGSHHTVGSHFCDFLGMGGDKQGESLVVAANNAHELARVLRQLKFEAYVLHTRTSSVVSVGGFSGPDDPEVERLRFAIATLQQQIAAASKDPTRKDPLGLFANPVPIEVPHP